MLRESGSFRETSHESSSRRRKWRPHVIEVARDEMLAKVVPFARHHTKVLPVAGKDGATSANKHVTRSSAKEITVTGFALTSAGKSQEFT